MQEREISPLDQAEKEIPTRWYEIDSQKKMLIPGVITALGAIIYKYFVPNDPLAIKIIGASIYAIGTIADISSTTKALNSINSAREAGIDVGESGEGNPFRQNIKTGKDFFRKPASLGLELGVAAIVCFFPTTAGFMGGVGRASASISNMRLAKRCNRATEISLNDPGVRS